MVANRTAYMVAITALMVSPLVCAQSNVNIYGILDASVAYTKGNSSKTSLRSGDLAAPRFGFRGSEVIKSGLKVNFALEAALNVDTGAGAATNTNNQLSGATASGALTFNRQSWVGLEGNWGELRLGRNFNPTFRQYVIYDPFMGGGIGASQAAHSSLATYGYSPSGIRHSNAVEYWLPSKQALTGQFMYAMGENGSGANNSKDGNYLGGRLAYQFGEANIGIAMGKMRNATLHDIKEMVFGGKYKLGNANLMAMYTRSETGVGSKQKGWLLGATFRKKQMEYRASFSTSSTRNNTGNSIGRTHKIAAVAGYHLSKRTAVYVMGAYSTNSDGAALPLLGSAADMSLNGSSRTISLGMVHTF